MYTGSCLCGGFRYRIEGELKPIQICHCSQCRKAQGSALVTNIPVDENKFNIVAGSELVGSFESSPGKQRCFCKNCGSPLFSKSEAVPGVIRIRAGTLDGDLNTKPIAHFYTTFKANWFEINDDLPKFAEGYVRD